METYRSGILFDLEGGEYGNVVSLAWAEYVIRKKRGKSKMEYVFELGNPKHRFVSESVRSLRENSEYYNLPKFRRECEELSNLGVDTVLKSWDSVMEEFECDLADNGYYALMSHSVDKDAEKLKNTNDLYSKYKGRFDKDPINYPNEFSDRQVWNNVNWVCTQMMMKDRAPTFKDALAISYITGNYTYKHKYGGAINSKKYNGGPNEMLSLKLEDILTYKFGYARQSHTAYQDVLDLSYVLKDILVTDGISAFPSSNYYVRNARATIDIR